MYRFHIYEITLVVEERFKGTSPDTVRVVTEYDSCSYFGPFTPPDLGERHLLFFYQAATALPLRARDCTGSRSWARVPLAVREELRKQ